MNEIKPGQLYRHYKGDVYKIITLAKSSETEEDLVVYERQTDIAHHGWKIWTRPLAMFVEVVDTPNYKGKRFTLIQD